MNEDFDYSHVPPSFTHCFQASCARAGGCLRRLAALHIPPDVWKVEAVNPRSVPGDGSECPHFITTQKARIAWGTKHLVDNVPHKVAVAIRKELIRYFSKTIFFRIQRKERYLTPAEQDYIRAVFRRYGVKEEPAYEYYTEEYPFDCQRRSR